MLQTQLSNMIQRLSVELTNRCSKGCSFCYNQSNELGGTKWLPDEVIGFVKDCAEHGIEAVSFGGGEPLQYDQLDYVLTALKGSLFRSITTNGLQLTNERLDRLANSAPDKVHVSIHFPEDMVEVQRVVKKVLQLDLQGASRSWE
ncbi:MAG: radical SAM protein [Pirellulales bacterium]